MAKKVSPGWWTPRRAQGSVLLVFAIFEPLLACGRAVIAWSSLDLLDGLRPLPRRAADDKADLLRLEAGEFGLKLVLPLALLSVLLAAAVVIVAYRRTREDAAPPVPLFLALMGVGCLQIGAGWANGADFSVPIVGVVGVLATPSLIRLDQRERKRRGLEKRS